MKLIAGMLLRQYDALLFGRYICVDLRRSNGTVPQHLLNISDIHILLQKKRGKGMPKHMRRDRHGNRRDLHISVEHIPDGLFPVALMETVEKEPAGGFDLAAAESIVFIYNPYHFIVGQLHQTFLVSFSMNLNNMLGHVYMFFFQHTQLRDPGAGLE